MTRRGKRKVVVAVRPNPTAKAKTRLKEKKELTRLGAALRTLGGLGGSAVGGFFGNAPAGATVGTGLGAALSRWLGSGDYSVTKNSLVSSMKASGTIPMMHESGQSIIVRHKEFLGEVRSSIDFSVQASYPLNPGLQGSFPWLCRLAAAYQQYEIKGMVFHYVPTSGNAVASTNNALGSVMMQTSYRVTDSAPVSKVELLNEYWSTEVIPSDTTCHPIECNPKENPFSIHYVRTGALPEDENALMYDVGVTHVCTSGQQTNGVVLGDLWVSYEIEFKKPIVASDVTSSVGRNFYVTDDSFAPVTTDNYFPLAITRTNGILDIEVQSRSVIFPRLLTGEFDIIITFRGTGAVTNPNTVGAPVCTGCTVINYVTSPTGNADRIEFNGTGSLISWTYICSIRKPTKSDVGVVTLPASTPSGVLLDRTILVVYRKTEV